jgi:dihydroorotase
LAASDRLPAAEEILVYREIALARLTGARVHILHVSTAGSVELIRQAQRRGVRVTGEACPHHFILTDEYLRDRSTNFKMSPPLPTEKDVQVILNGLRDGTLDVVSAEHAP